MVLAETYKMKTQAVLNRATASLHKDRPGCAGKGTHARPLEVVRGGFSSHYVVLGDKLLTTYPVYLSEVQHVNATAKILYTMNQLLLQAKTDLAVLVPLEKQQRLLSMKT
jgi:hypothetical protein